MNKKEALQVLAILSASYPKYYLNITDEETQGIVSVWALQFASIHADIVLMALNKVVSESEYPPNIATVKKKIESLHWEAYEHIERNYRMKNLSPEQLEYYKRIYKATERYKFGKVEPTISEMLPNNTKLIERRE